MTIAPPEETQGTLEVGRAGRVLTLTIANPAAKNALGPHMYAIGAEAIEAAARDADVGAIVLAGAGDTFCSGGNVRRLRANRERPREVARTSIDALHRWVGAMRRSPKPVIAAVEGIAAGAGCSVALACDLIVAASDARFAMSYVKIGLTPDGGGTASLGRLVPRQLAAEMLFEGGAIAAERLHALGVVNRVVARGPLHRARDRIAARIASGPTQAIARAKRLLAAAPASSFGDQLELERDMFLAGLYGVECGEGTAAFVEKRPAKFHD
jgi:enoyl-CoA hydratase/carnithine racemase